MIRQTISDLKRVFAVFDADGGGGVAVGELAFAMKRLGRRPADVELAMAMGVESLLESQFARNFDVYEVNMDFVSFVNMLAGSNTKAQRALRTQVVNYRESFRLFDQDGGGSISIDEFATGLIDLGQLQLTYDEITSMVTNFASEDTGEIDPNPNPNPNHNPNPNPNWRIQGRLILFNF